MLSWIFLLSLLASTCLPPTNGIAVDDTLFLAASSPDATGSWITNAAATRAQSTVGSLTHPALNEFNAHTVIRPQIYHDRHKKVLDSTLNTENGLHHSQLTLTYHHKGQNVQIDLHRNDELLPDEHFLRYQNSKTTKKYVVQNFTKTEIALCQYQGTIRGIADSNVAISTCNGGVNGVIFDGHDTYFVHSASDGSLQDEHFLLDHSDIKENNATCGYNPLTDNYLDVVQNSRHMSAANSIIKESEFNRILRYKRSAENNNAIRGPFNANKHSSYVELVIVVDNKMYKSFGENTKKVHQHCKDLANIVNALYVPLNIFVALVGVVIWNESNEIEFSSNGDVTLRNFLNYRRTKLVLEHPNDNAQLLTKETFSGGVVGKAFKGPICTHEFSGGVSTQHSESISVVAATMAHEMGHNFGMEHDSSDCKCEDERCIMSASSTSVVPVHWSSCSIDQLNFAFSRGMNYCLRNKPTKLFESPQCGNGFVEPGEQCDCGLPKFCQNSCCDPHTCMLYKNASCATGECCNFNTCRPKTAGTACREAENDCDLPEYCTGESEYCPLDVFKRDTIECDKGRAYCYQGNCRSHSAQCRILWGPTGENSPHCYDRNTNGNRTGNCGHNRLDNSFLPCRSDDVNCGMMHCRHLNERLEFGMESAAVLTHAFITHGGEIVPCRSALVDLGLTNADPGLAPNGAKCGNDKMCMNTRCRTIEDVRAEGMGRACPDNCNGNGICNSRGNCHCNIGFSGVNCLLPGSGGSVDSGPATNPNSHEAFQRFMYIFFFAVMPFMAGFCFLMYYCRHHPFFIGSKFAENIIKTASGGSKQPVTRTLQNGALPTGSAGPGTIGMANGLAKSTPSSTDDMNSALLKSPSVSSDVNIVQGNGMFGKFKGFTLRPLNDANNVANAPNIAYVQPTVQDSNSAGVPQRAAPPPPKHQADKNPTRKTTAPALPPPNPGSTARPIISLPVLETSTLTKVPKNSITDNEKIMTLRAAPDVPVNNTQTLKAAPAPPVPLHADAKLNMRRDGTIRRIASFLKKEDKPALKEKTYIDRERLRTLEISAPLPVTTTIQAESSNSDSETTTPREEETKNLVKRTQSMRSPTKKLHVQTFGSMRHATGSARPKSAVSGSSAVATTQRPKSPPPRPPPLKKTNSTTSSGYQLPVATAKSIAENTYDDCEFVEQPISKIDELDAAGARSTDNIYSVIEEIPPAAQTLKRSDLVNISSVNSDIGLLGEIVNEIEKRNGESIYKATTLSKVEAQQQENQIVPNMALLKTEKFSKTETVKATTPNAATPAYLRPAAVNAPVARVAPTRSDLSPTTAFSSFKPTVAGTATNNKSNSFASATATAAASNRFGAAVARNKSFGKTPNKAMPGSNAAAAANTQPSATIQKPKPLSAKPYTLSSQDRKTANSQINAGPTGTPRVAPTIKSSNIATLTQRFENKLSNDTNKTNANA